MHGFDEWFGNLYHLNAEEEPEELDYPGQKSPEYTGRKYRSRTGHCTPGRRIRTMPTEDPKFGKSRQAEDRRHRQANAQADGDVRQGSDRRDAQVARQGSAKGGKPFFLLVQLDRNPHLVTFAEKVHSDGGR